MSIDSISETSAAARKLTWFQRVISVYDYFFAVRLKQSRPRSFWHSLALTVVISATGIYANWQTIRMQTYHISSSSHASLALEIAINRVACGKVSHIVPDRPGSPLPIHAVMGPGRDHVDLSHRVLLSLPEQMAGSRADYCTGATRRRSRSSAEWACTADCS